MAFQATTGIPRVPRQVPKIQTAETDFSSLKPSFQNPVVFLDLDNRQAGNSHMLVDEGCTVRLMPLGEIDGLVTCPEKLLPLLLFLEWLSLL